MDEKEVAITLALRAGETLRAGWEKTDLKVEKKGVINLITEVDQRSDAVLKEGLIQAFPRYGVLSEEGSSNPGQVPARWIIDPLDGTTNYIKGYPFVAVSIGLEKEGRLELGVVYNPILNELYVGQQGSGATLNGRPIHVSTVSDLDFALVASGFPYDVRENPNDNMAEWSRFIKHCVSARCDGSAALDMCFVASGRLDGYWESGTSPWDVAAGAVIVREAGGTASDYLGGEGFLEYKGVVASNSILHRDMLSLIQVKET